MTECRHKIVAYKTCRETASAPKLRSPQPTSATFLENVKRFHYQVCNWKPPLLLEPPSISPAEFGWEADIENKTLLARSLPDATALAPDYILRLIRCSCHSGVPCKAGNCSCLRNQLTCTCTVFCACEGNRFCCNPYTEHIDDGDDYLHMFDYTDTDFTVNWSLWKTSSMIWYHIKPNDTMKGPKILVKQCIISLFYENLVLWVHSVMWHSKSSDKMYPQNKIAFCQHHPSQKNILSVLSYYSGHCMDVTRKEI